jgi:hypothetical protein
MLLIVFIDSNKYCMPRLSLYKPEKGNDYKFLDKSIYEMFQVGGTDVFVHKYLGPQDPSDPNQATSPSTIQDVLFLENRDRKYDSSVYVIRGIYNVQDIDFNLSQFGLFLQNDTIFMTVHINSSVDILGRKIMSGDVLELPHLVDDFALNDFAVSLKRFYVIEDVNRASEGFSVTWWPHLYRLKCKPIVDSQEFKDILDLPQNMDTFAGDFNTSTTYYPGQTVKYNGVLYNVTAQVTNIAPPNSLYYTQASDSDTLRYVMSTYNKEILMNDGVVAEAEAAAPLSGYDTSNYYTLQTDAQGNSELVTVDSSELAIDGVNTADAVNVSPDASAYQGYLIGSNTPPNGVPYGFGIAFPTNAALGDYFLRVDYYPNRLFRYDGTRWVKFQDDVQMTMTNVDNRQIEKLGFINNTAVTNINPIYTDTISIATPFTATQLTASVDTTTGTVVTTIPYSADYGIEVFVNGQSMPLLDVINSNGNIGFVTAYVIVDGDSLRWTIYSKKVVQRIPLSQASKLSADM